MNQFAYTPNKIGSTMIGPNDIYPNIFHTLQGHTKAITRIEWAANGDKLASCSESENRIIVWDLRNDSNFLMKSFSDEPLSIAWSPDGRMLASGSNNGTIRIFSTNEGKILKKFTAHRKDIFCMAWSPIGNFLASGSEAKTIAIWDTLTRDKTQLLEGSPFPIYDVVWSPDGKSLASALGHDKIKLLDAVNKTHNIITIDRAKNPMIYMDWFPQKDMIAFDFAADKIGLLDLKSKRIVKLIRLDTKRIISATISLDAGLIAARTIEGRVFICQIGPDNNTKPFCFNMFSKVPNSFFGNIEFNPKKRQLASLINCNKDILINDLDYFDKINCNGNYGINQVEIKYIYIRQTEKEWIKFCLVQLDFDVEPLSSPVFGWVISKKETIRRKIFEALKIASQKQVDIICFPELSFLSSES